jgi:hypothetical protein
LLQTFTELGGVEAMALQAKRTHIREVTFTAAFRDWQHMIGIPKRLTAAHSPVGCGLKTGGPAKALQTVEFGHAVDATHGADAAVPFEDSLPQVPRIAAHPPLFHAPI